MSIPIYWHFTTPLWHFYLMFDVYSPVTPVSMKLRDLVPANMFNLSTFCLWHVQCQKHVMQWLPFCYTYHICFTSVISEVRIFDLMIWWMYYSMVSAYEWSSDYFYGIVRAFKTVFVFLQIKSTDWSSFLWKFQSMV